MLKDQMSKPLQSEFWYPKICTIVRMQTQTATWLFNEFCPRRLWWFSARLRFVSVASELKFDGRLCLWLCYSCQSSGPIGGRNSEFKIRMNLNNMGKQIHETVILSYFQHGLSFIYAPPCFKPPAEWRSQRALHPRCCCDSLRLACWPQRWPPTVTVKFSKTSAVNCENSSLGVWIWNYRKKCPNLESKLLERKTTSEQMGWQQLRGQRKASIAHSDIWPREKKRGAQ